MPGGVQEVVGMLKMEHRNNSWQPGLAKTPCCWGWGTELMVPVAQLNTERGAY